MDHRLSHRGIPRNIRLWRAVRGRSPDDGTKFESKQKQRIRSSQSEWVACENDLFGRRFYRHQSSCVPIKSSLIDSTCANSTIGCQLEFVHWLERDSLRIVHYIRLVCRKMRPTSISISSAENFMAFALIRRLFHSQQPHRMRPSHNELWVEANIFAHSPYEFSICTVRASTEWPTSIACTSALCISHWMYAHISEARSERNETCSCTNDTPSRNHKIMFRSSNSIIWIIEASRRIAFVASL